MEDQVGEMVDVDVVQVVQVRLEEAAAVRVGAEETVRERRRMQQRMVHPRRDQRLDSFEPQLTWKARTPLSVTRQLGDELLPDGFGLAEDDQGLHRS